MKNASFRSACSLVCMSGEIVKIMERRLLTDCPNQKWNERRKGSCSASLGYLAGFVTRTICRYSTESRIGVRLKLEVR